MNDILTKPARIILICTLTCCASFILGLLSFNGFMALWPNIPLALVAFLFSVTYEIDIYYQNLHSALAKLFNRQYLEIELARTYLQQCFPTGACDNTWPLFFKTYQHHLHQRFAIEAQPLHQQSIAEKKRLEQVLWDSEVLFSQQLNSKQHPTNKTPTPEIQELRAYLNDYSKQFQRSLPKRHRLFQLSAIFSALTAIFIGIASLYLLVFTCELIPYFQSVPQSTQLQFIAPIAILSGLSYGLLNYNTLTNMIINKTFYMWFHRIKQDITLHGLSLRNSLMIGALFILCILALILSICTAGTWITIIKKTRSLFIWMSKIPKIIMNIVMPVITSLSSLIFNLENSSESFDVLNDFTQKKQKKRHPLFLPFIHSLQHFRKNENILQLINPFRLVLMLTMRPCQFIFFLFHLISLSLTSNQVPGVSKIGLSILGLARGGVQEARFWMNHNINGQSQTQALLSARLHGNVHQHKLDLPWYLITSLAFPLFVFSSIWDYFFSQLNSPSNQLTFRKAIQKQGIKNPRFGLYKHST